MLYRQRRPDPETASRESHGAESREDGNNSNVAQDGVIHLEAEYIPPGGNGGAIPQNDKYEENQPDSPDDNVDGINGGTGDTGAVIRGVEIVDSGIDDEDSPGETGQSGGQIGEPGLSEVYTRASRSKNPAGSGGRGLRRLYAVYCAVTLAASITALFYIGGDFINNSVKSGYFGELLMSRVFGVSGDSDAAALIEIMLEQSFRGRGKIPGTDGITADEGNPGTAWDFGRFTDFIPAPSSGLSGTETDPPAAQSPATAESLYDFDYSRVPEGHLPIIPTDLSARHLGEFYLSNETKYKPDARAVIDNYSPAAGNPAETPNRDVSASAEAAPLVLILHTHGTEAYAEEGSVSYSDGYNTARSSDVTQNVVAVGAAMTEVFIAAGIPAIHCGIMHDEISYMESYSRSAATIKQYLAEYPSIKYVLDVHRDSVIRTGGEKIRPLTLHNGEPTAQVMTVVGTDDRGANHPDWMSNFTLAARLQERLNVKYDKIARPINLRGAAFNQQYTQGSLLLEIGSCGNTLNEAIRAAKIVAAELAELIIDY